jgi:hypothetical protein
MLNRRNFRKGPCRVEEIEEAMDVFFDPEFIAIPGIIGNPGLEIFHLEPVFDINGQEDGGLRLSVAGSHFGNVWQAILNAECLMVQC